MRKNPVEISIPKLATMLVWIIMLLYGGPLSAMSAPERIGATTEKTMTAAGATGEKSTSDQIEVAMGREFKVTLASNATTGYHWELAAPLDATIVELVSSAYQEPQSGLIGAGGKEIWTFKAVGRGKTVIELKYVRPWEKEAPPAETASYQVTVP